MAAWDDGSGDREQRAERHRARRSSDQQVALWVIMGVGTLFLLVVVVLVITSGSSGSKAAAPRVVIQVAPVAPSPGPAPPPIVIDPKGVLPGPRTSDRADTGRPRRSTIREKIDKAFEAGKRRAELYAKEGRWGDAIAAMEETQGGFDDVELRLRCQPVLDDLNEKARSAVRAKKTEAEKLVEAGRYDDACKTLKEIVEKFKLEGHKEEVNKRVEEIQQRKTTEAAARFVRLMTPVEEDIAGWGFLPALEKASKLHFDEPEYQEQLTGRIERIRSLIGLRKKMIDTIHGSIPRLTRKALRVPGGFDGDLVEADHNRIVTEGERGKDAIPWPKLGAEATTLLALRAGNKDDPNHRIAVGRLLMEVHHFAKAREQFAIARKLGADPTADEGELARRIQDAAKGKETPKEAEPPKPKADGK